VDLYRGDLYGGHSSASATCVPRRALIKTSRPRRPLPDGSIPTAS
jgi:hypothetical protein